MAELVSTDEENVADTAKTIINNAVSTKDQNIVDIKEIPVKIRHYLNEYRTEAMIALGVIAVLWLGGKK